MFQIIVLTYFLLGLTYAQDDLLVCKPAKSVFSGIVTIQSGDHSIAQGPSGKRGPKGDRGFPGPIGPQGSKGSAGSVDYEIVRQQINNQTSSSCKAIKERDNSAANGLYDIRDEKGSVYRTYCDMTTAGGGWSLVASVHENFMQGKCTMGDRWSSENGNNALHPHGDGAWENTVMFGAPESAASDDYKNQGYFNMAARDVMIWHVPNNTPTEKYKTKAFMMYHTASDFLGTYGGNLYKLFSQHYPLRSGTFYKNSGNGPSYPIVWDRGNNAIMVQNTPPYLRGRISPGFIQFRAINHERGAYALCPGVKIVAGQGDVEHVCIGGTSNQGNIKYCGDFGAKDWGGYATGKGSSANRAMTESVVMIFYR